MPDKGERIKDFRARIIKELNRKNEVETAASLLSRLNIASEGKTAMSELEWTGKYAEKKDTDVVKVIELDSDDEEDSLKILAQPTGSGTHKKKIVHLTPEESLVKPEDLVEIASFENDEITDVEHVKYLVDKVEKANTKRKPFLPHKTTKSNVHDPMKEKERKLNKHWEVTAATPPLILHGAAKVLSLNESLKLQREQAHKLQEIQTKHAAERLAEQLGLHSLRALPNLAGAYRIPEERESSSSSESEDEEHEVHDEEDTDKGGTVVYTVDSIEH